MTEEKKSYNQILKSTSIFGGVQIYQIIIAIIRSKFVAVLLGPAGMGISGLYSSTISLVSSVSSFGLGTSAVRNISIAHSTGNSQRLGEVAGIFKKLVWITGFLGFSVTILFSSFLSEWTFGNNEYTYAFITLSVVLIFTQLNQGNDVIIRGTGNITYLAKSNVIGGTIGLILSIPLYYFWGISGIVPALIIASLTSFILSWYFSSKIKIIKPINISFKDFKKESADMLKMGILLSISGIISTFIANYTRIFIGKIGSIDDVGFYNAGFNIMNVYVGMVFTAISMDYYPRLSAVSNDNKKTSKLINQQIEVALLILGPILCIFLMFMPLIVTLLYSSKFDSINPMIEIASIGLLLKAGGWAIGYIFLAKGASKLFFWNELIANIYMMSFALLGYYYFGLIGIGYAFTIGYLLYLIQVYFISKVNYSFFFENNSIMILSVELLLLLIIFFIISFDRTIISYLSGGFFTCVAIIFSFLELNKRIDLKLLLKRK